MTTFLQLSDNLGIWYSCAVDTWILPQYAGFYVYKNLVVLHYVGGCFSG